jgi:hypothetical protein
MDPLIWGPLVGGVPATIGAVLLYKATRSTAKGTEQIETVKVQIDGWERLHNADLVEQDRLKLALVEERAVSQAFAVKADRLQLENDELRALLALAEQENRERPG